MAPHRSPTKWLEKHGLNDRERLFVLAYLEEPNQTRAAKNAGYKNPANYAARIMEKARVRAAIAEGRSKIEKPIMANAMDAAQRLADLAFADVGEITQHRRGACRYCHGTNHAYQWRTPDELTEHAASLAREAFSDPEAIRAAIDNPSTIGVSDEGGFGYRRNMAPNPDCPLCEGDGIEWVHIADTRDMSPTARALFDGVKETRQGIEVKIQDRSKHLEMLAKHLGMFAGKGEDNPNEGLLALAKQIHANAQSVPVATNNAPVDEDEGDE